MAGIRDVLNRIKNFFNPNKPKALPKANRDLQLYGMLDRFDMESLENPNNYNDFCKQFFSVGDNFAKQYDYVDVISRMRENGSFEEFKEYLAFVQNNSDLYYPSAVHGIDHTSRVVFNAAMLCDLDKLSPHDKNLIMVAAQLHDIGREDDAKNFDHGAASKDKLRRLGLLRNFGMRDQEIIEFAVSCHSLSRDQVAQKLEELPKKDRADFSRVLMYLQDADKLDRTRIANEQWKLDPNRLSTDTAKRLVKVAHANFWSFHKVMEYDRMTSQNNPSELTDFQKFEEIRGLGYNITLEQFKDVLAEFKPGTYETLRAEGKLRELFSYQTYLKYKKEETFDEKLSPYRVNPDEMFREVTEKEQTALLRESFDREYLLYHTLKKNNPDAYSIVCYTDIDAGISQFAGVASVMDFKDLDKFSAQGYKLRLNDLLYLAKDVRPEVYEEILRSGDVSQLFEYKNNQDPQGKTLIYDALQRAGRTLPEDYIEKHYGLLKAISTISPAVFASPRFNDYSLVETFTAASKLLDAKYRIIDGKSGDFDYTTDTIFDLIDYSRQVKIEVMLSDDEQVDIAENFAKDSELTRDPRFIEYINKRNKPYTTKNIYERINYNKFCTDSLLVDYSIDLETAKSNFINGLFNLDVPPQYAKRFQKEAIETLYYCKKYSPDALAMEGEDIVGALLDVLTATDLETFKENLYKNRELINTYNTEAVRGIAKDTLMQISREDVAERLNETEEVIKNLPTVATKTRSGKPVEAKVLSGQDFFLGVSTSMPRCSHYTRAITEQDPDNARANIYNNMMHRPLNPNDRCVSAISQEFLAHAGAALQDQELIYGYVPESKENVSIMGIHDMSTTKKNGESRTTQKTTTPRKMGDLVAGTTEEHNEMVMNGVYPRFLICFDEVSDAALEKKQILLEEYRKQNIDQEVDIVVIDAKGSYIPAIKDRLFNEHAQINEALKTGQFTSADFERLFEEHESNLVLRTLQAIHSTSFSDDLWDLKFNKVALDSLTSILEKMADLCPPEKVSVLNGHIQTLLDRGDRYTEYGQCVYDKAYDNQIDRNRLGRIYDKLNQRGEFAPMQQQTEQR